MRHHFDTQTKNEIYVNLDRVVEYIKHHYFQDLSLEKLAAVAHISKYHFHRLFREHFGETVHDCVRRVRLEHAAYMLTTDLYVSVAQIAEDCGFSSSQNLARAFKERFGVSPTAARKNPDQHTISKIKGQRINDYFLEPLNVEIKKLPSYHVAYIRNIGPYDVESSVQVFQRLIKWALNKKIMFDAPAIPIVAGWSDPAITYADECILDVCITVSKNIKREDEVHMQDLPGGTFAVLHCECMWDVLFLQFNRLVYEWLPKSKFQRDTKPVLFIYYNNPYMNMRRLAIVDICLPVKSQKE